jgi:hypothetical protein
MTKIEKYKEAKGIANKIANAVEKSLGRDGPKNDKATFRCSFSHIISEQWTPMCFQIEASYGYYGSSSGYTVTSKELGEYLAKAINAHRALLLDHAAKLAAEDAEKARKDAEEEARSVLQETDKKAAYLNPMG